MSRRFELNRETTVHVTMSEREYCKLNIIVPHNPYPLNRPEDYPGERVSQLDSKWATVTLYRDEETGILVDDIGKFEKWIERVEGAENESQA